MRKKIMPYFRHITSSYSNHRKRQEQRDLQMVTLTQTSVKASLKAIGVIFKCVDGEYQIKLKGATEASTYFTDDLQDAYNTGFAMKLNS